MTERQRTPAPRGTRDPFPIPGETSFREELNGLRGETSRRKFALLTGIPPRTLKQYEDGTEIPSTYAIHRMCNRLGLDPNDRTRTILQLTAVDARVAQGG